MLISVVIPIFNESGNILELVDNLKIVLARLTEYSYEIIFIDDGSSDDTLKIINELSKQDKKIKYLSFSRNFGHQSSIKAGLDHADGSCVITMDGDLQHPPELIYDLVVKWQEGFDVVYTIRKDDPRIGFLKRKMSSIFYKVINFLADIKVEPGSADFRLLDRRVVDVLKNMDEVPVFFRGMVKWVGFKQVAIYYMPNERFWGKSKYMSHKMFSFALNGITSFSIKPLRLSTCFGAVIAFLSFIYALYAVYLKLFTGVTIQGWASLLIVIAFIGGIQLIMMGIIGEYIGKLFIEHKNRPSYIIKEKSNV